MGSVAQRHRQGMDRQRRVALDPKVLFYTIWATTQHFADFGSQIAMLNGGAPLDDEGFAAAKRQVVATLLHGIGADRPSDSPTKSQ